MVMEINDLQIGKAGEYLVCADLILKGHVSFPSEQGLPFDVLLADNKKIYKIQVKTTRKPYRVPQRKNRTDKYLFHVKRCGKGGNKEYNNNDVDIFALVGIDSRTIGYIKSKDIKRTMFFLPETTNTKGDFKRCSCKKLSDYRIEKCLI